MNIEVPPEETECTYGHVVATIFVSAVSVSKNNRRFKKNRAKNY